MARAIRPDKYRDPPSLLPTSFGLSASIPIATLRRLLYDWLDREFRKSKCLHIFFPQFRIEFAVNVFAICLDDLHFFSKRQMFILQGLPGIGPAKAKMLLDKFGTLNAIFSASISDLKET